MRTMETMRYRTKTFEIAGSQRNIVSGPNQIPSLPSIIIRVELNCEISQRVRPSGGLTVWRMVAPFTYFEPVMVSQPSQVHGSPCINLDIGLVPRSCPYSMSSFLFRHCSFPLSKQYLPFCCGQSDGSFAPRMPSHRCLVRPIYKSTHHAVLVNATQSKSCEI